MAKRQEITTDEAAKTDTLTVSVFKLFVVTGTGRGVEHVARLLPWVFAGAVVAAVIVTGTTAAIVAVIKALF